MKNFHKQTLNKLWTYFLMIPMLGLSLLLFSCADTESNTAHVEKQASAKKKKTPKNKKAVRADKASKKVENMPEFKGGFNGLAKYMGNNVQYPQSAYDAGIEGVSFVSFVINEKGEVTKAKIKEGFHPECDAEALRVINAMPNWTPGSNKGKQVSVELTVPVSFKVN